jgi:signal transduction histidine kinase
MQRQESAETACAQTLERVVRVFAHLKPVCPSRDLGQARELAIEAYAGFHSEDEALRAATRAFALRLFDAYAVDLARQPRRANALVERLHPVLGVSREALTLELLSRLSVAGRSPGETVGTVLGMLVGLTAAGGTSLWRHDRAGALHCVDCAGAGASSAAARALARRALLGDSSPRGPRAELFTLAIEERGQVVGALVARSDPRRRGTTQAAARVALEALAGAIARDDLMARNASDERALVEGGERRLMRLGFDLHDGPLQELLLLGEDLRLFREQLAAVLGDGGRQALLRGRLDDLDARLVALEGGLRRISTSLHASVLIDRPLAQALSDVVDAFAARADVAPGLRLDGDLNGISPSQRIALLSVVGEALNNVREHGGSVSAVHVSIDVGRDGVGARVVDDGCGFDVEEALLSAARRGRMGLPGIHERVRLLGGRCVVDSRPGGPTTVSLRLPRWEPLAAATPKRRRADRLASSG